MLKSSIKLTLLPILHFIRKIISVVRNHTTPPLSRRLKKSSFDFFEEDEIRDCYNHFKKHFYNAVFLDKFDLRSYALKEALLSHQENNFYLEFGVYQGDSINSFSKILKDIKIYGFDSFEGLRENYMADTYCRGAFDLKKKIPSLNKNVITVVGWVQDTLPKFLGENKNIQINFVHMDVDTYPSTKFILKEIKPFLKDKCVILFDEIYNCSSWKVGEYKALTEVFDEREYQFIGFGMHDVQAAIQFNKQYQI